MTKIMTPSAVDQPMTDGQIDKAVDAYRAMLRKHRDEIGSSKAVQDALGSDNYVGEQVGVLRKHVETMSNLIVRRGVKVNRNRTPQEAIDATGRRQYTDRKVVDAMPRGEGKEVDVYFFNLGRYVSDTDLEKEFELRGLKPADSYSLAAVNEVDPAFADAKPNSTHWQDANGKWCYTAFGRWIDGGRSVDVNRYGGGWGGRWWFGGLRK